jgi:tyrosyl-tRNA synthetase
MYFELLTELPLQDVDRLLGGHPKECKLALARTVISSYYEAAAADEAAARWQSEVGQGAMPAEIPIANVKRSDLTNGTLAAAQLLKITGLTPSTSDARRSIQQGGAYLGAEKTPIASFDQLVPVEDGLLVWVGKKRFCQIKLVE